ncbi:MAG: hypothetical protein H0Z39_00820 [Peptococcaceae bacterium]|nr:hypothetical protein [Peptococcaceae bacterium]
MPYNDVINTPEGEAGSMPGFVLTNTGQAAAYIMDNLGEHEVYIDVKTGDGYSVAGFSAVLGSVQNVSTGPEGRPETRKMVVLAEEALQVNDEELLAVYAALPTPNNQVEARMTPYRVDLRSPEANLTMSISRLDNLLEDLRKK